MIRKYLAVTTNVVASFLGCILVGQGIADSNKDGYLDVSNSKVALNKLLELAPKGFDLAIENKEVE